MTNSFYFKSSVLNYLIGYFLIFEKNVIIISPWLSDLEIKLPVNKNISENSIRLTKLIKINKNNILSVIVSTDKYNDYVLNRLPENVNTKKVKDLHAKAIVSDNLIYMGSANITRRGTSKNTEICQLSKNDFGSSKEFVKKRLGIKI